MKVGKNELLLKKIDILAVIGDYIDIEQRNGMWWGRCPFHAGGKERTPALRICTESKLYYCFACEKSGNVIDFVMEMDRITSLEAVNKLAIKYSAHIDYGLKNEVSRLLNILISKMKKCLGLK